MLVAILKYDCITRPIPHGTFWRQRFEDDWRFSYKCFSLGVPMFIVVLAQVGWITFSKYKHRDSYEWYVPATMISFVAFLCLTLWYIHTTAKWTMFNADGAQIVEDPLDWSDPEAPVHIKTAFPKPLEMARVRDSDALDRL